jgi:hypothetical protein
MIREHLMEKKSFFRFNIENNNKETPLALCCKNGNLKAFEVIWPRAGKTNHNPTYCFLNACIGGNIQIIKSLYNHPKFNFKDPIVYQVLLDGLAGKYGPSVLDLIRSRYNLKSGQIIVIDKVCSNLKSQGFFKNKVTGVLSTNKKLKRQRLAKSTLC